MLGSILNYQIKNSLFPFFFISNFPRAFIYVAQTRSAWVSKWLNNSWQKRYDKFMFWMSIGYIIWLFTYLANIVPFRQFCIYMPLLIAAASRPTKQIWSPPVVANGNGRYFDYTNLSWT